MGCGCAESIYSNQLTIRHNPPTPSVTVAWDPPCPTKLEFLIAVIILAALVPALILVAIVTIAILLLLGPVVGNVFSNIVQNLEATPMPR